MPLSATSSVSARALLLRGLLAGLVAGIVAFGVAYVVGEPSLRTSVALEDAEGTVVPRSLQSTAGLLSATVLAGVALGGLVGTVSALALGRFGRLGVRATTLLVTGVGFAAVYVMPFLVYPPNPPTVGRADTIGYRTALYFAMVAIALVAALTAVVVGRRLAGRWGSWYAGLAVTAGFVLVTAVAGWLMPSYDEVPDGFPASVLASFRRGSFLTQLTLWSVLGVTLAELAHRLGVRAAGAAPDRALVGVRG